MAAGAGGAAVLGMDTLMASGALRSDSKAAAKPSSAPVNGSSLDGGLSLDGVPVMVDEGSLDEMTQPPTPLEPSSGNLRSLVASREGRALLDVKGLQPVCWNVVAGDLVRALWGRAGRGGAWGVRAISAGERLVCSEMGWVEWGHFSMAFSHLVSPRFVVNSPELAGVHSKVKRNSFGVAAGLANAPTKNTQVHNFADGVTIGAAFLSCSTSIGWTVTASAILHEIPHELADFMALLKGGMSVKQVRVAAVYLFLASLCLCWTSLWPRRI